MSSLYNKKVVTPTQHAETDYKQCVQVCSKAADGIVQSLARNLINRTSSKE